MGTASLSRLCDCFVANNYQEIGSEWDNDDKPASALQLQSAFANPKQEEAEAHSIKKGTNGSGLVNGTNGKVGSVNGSGGSGHGTNGNGSARRGSNTSLSSNVSNISIASNGSKEGGKTEAIEIRNPNVGSSSANSMIGNQEMTKTIFFAKYDLRDEIGVGSTSKCYKCVRRSDNK